MPLSPDLWPKLAHYARSKLVSLFDPSRMFAEASNLRESLDIDHKGFYIGIVDSGNKELIREGFLQDAQSNVLASVDVNLTNIYNSLNAKGVTPPTIETATLFFSMIDDCIYIKNPLEWDEGTDGICFQWGQRYKGLYLPYQINRSSATKYEIMDRLCSLQAGVASNLWRQPEGLIFRLIVDSYQT